MPAIAISTCSFSSASAGIVTTVAVLKWPQAFAATRSSGTPAIPIRSSSRCTSSTTTAEGAVIFGAGAECSRESVCSPPKRLSGVKRQSSSRPVRGLKSSTLYEVMRSAREASRVFCTLLGFDPWWCSSVARRMVSSCTSSLASFSPSWSMPGMIGA